MKSAILDQWDLNHDGKISKSELTMMILQQSRMVEPKAEFDDDDDAE